MRKRFDDFSNFFGKQNRSFGRATGTDHSFFTGKRYKQITSALTPHPRHSILRNPTVQIGVNGRHDVFPQVAINLLKKFRVVPFKGFKIGFNNTVVFCFFRMTSLIDQGMILQN